MGTAHLSLPGEHASTPVIPLKRATGNAIDPIRRHPVALLIRPPKEISRIDGQTVGGPESCGNHP